MIKTAQFFQLLRLKPQTACLYICYFICNKYIFLRLSFCYLFIKFNSENYLLSSWLKIKGKIGSSFMVGEVFKPQTKKLD